MTDLEQFKAIISKDPELKFGETNSHSVAGDPYTILTIGTEDPNTGIHHNVDMVFRADGSFFMMGSTFTCEGDCDQDFVPFGADKPEDELPN